MPIRFSYGVSRLEPGGNPDEAVRRDVWPDVERGTIRPIVDRRLVVHATGPETIRMLPALTVSEQEVDEAVRRLGAALH